MDIHEKAALFANHLARKARDNGARFTTLDDSAPDWMLEAVHAAHGDKLPNDWSYDAVAHLLDHIANADDIEDAEGDAIESCVDIYTGDLCAWLGSHACRVAYCDEAIAEYGAAFALDGGTLGLIQAGQRVELREIWGALVAALEAADVSDDADD